MTDGQFFRIERPMSIGVGLNEARVISGEYIGIRNASDPSVFDLYRMDAHGEPTGLVCVQMADSW